MKEDSCMNATRKIHSLTQGLAVTDFHPRVPLVLSKETVEEVKKICRKSSCVRNCHREACTTTFFFFP